MHTQQSHVQALNNPAPHFANHGNVARTMSSREIANLTGKRHDNVKRTIDSLVESRVIASPQIEEKPTAGRPVADYIFSGEKGKRDTFVVVAQLCPEFTGALVDRWQELESQVAKPTDLTKLEILQMAIESEKARVLLTVEVEQQATKIHSLENLFKEGMTHTQFCKGLNGVNVMQVGNFLESRNWLYNESRSGTRHRVGSYARDKYMTEHQHEVIPHGKDPFISYTPVLLKKGAARLYDLYLAGELPMKKTWNGLFTHDKALRAA